MSGSDAPSGRSGEHGIVVGLQATDGVVLAADTRTVQGGVVSSDDVNKLAAVHPTAAIGWPTTPGDTAALRGALATAVDRYEARRGTPISVPALARVTRGELRSDPALDGPVVISGVDDSGTHIFTVGADAGVLSTDVAAVGSGKQAATAVLDREDAETLSIDDARRVAADAIESAAARDPRIGSTIDFAAISEDGVAMRRDESIEDGPS